jgi:hypothetical protein
MGFRFRKGVRLFPGLRLNVTKQGISSLSIGGKGLTYNIGKKGTRSTVGLPGSGLSYSKYASHTKTSSGERIDPETGEIFPAQKEQGTPWGLIVIIALVVLGVYFFRTQA